MKITNKQKVILIIAFIVAGLLSLRIVAFRTNRFEQQTNKSIEKSRLFLTELANLLNTSEDLLIASRGFQQMNDHDFLVAYRNTKRATEEDVQQLLSLSEERENAFRKTVDTLVVLVKRKMELSDKIIQLSQNNTEGLLAQYINEGTSITKQIISVSAGLSAYETSHLTQLEASAAKTSKLFTWLFVVNLVALFLVLVVGFFLFYRSLKARSKAEKILESYKQSNQFINALAEGIIVQNERGYIIECNTAAQTILGLTERQLHGKQVRELQLKTVYTDGSAFPVEDHPASVVLKTGIAQRNIAMGIQKPNNHLTWIQINSHPIHSEEGVLEGVVTTFIDNTEQKQAADQLTQSEQYRKTFMNAVDEGLLMIDQSYHVIIANSASKQILRNHLGIIVKEGINLFNRLPEERKTIVLNHLEKVFKGERVEYEVFYDFIPGRKESWISYSIAPVMNDNKVIVAACITVRDITERKKIEQDLQKNEERLRLALDKTGDNAWEHNYKTGITWFSSFENHFLGYNQEELSEQENESRWWDSTHPEDLHLLKKSEEEYNAGVRESHSMEYRIYHKDGTMKWVLDRGVIIERNADGTPLRIVGTHTDITNEKELQNKLVEHEQQKKEAIVEAVIQAQEKEREEISYELHEEVSQILTSVKVLLGIATQEPTNTTTYLKQASERITEAIEGLRKISQNINSSTLRLVGLTGAITDLVNDAKRYSDIQFEIDQKNFKDTIAIDFSIQLTIFRSVQEQIKNIIRHSEATAASIVLCNTDKKVEVSIIDNGKGFNKSYANQGLGFKNIIHRAEQYRGSVEIYTEPGKGCQLDLVLPLSAM